MNEYKVVMKNGSHAYTTARTSKEAKRQFLFAVKAIKHN